MSKLYKFPNIINIEHAKVRLYVKSTDLDFVYGQDEDGRYLTYNVSTTELSQSKSKDLGKCGPDYRIDGTSCRGSGAYPIPVQGIRDNEWSEMNPIFRIFLLALINPHVGGDECVKMFKLYGYSTDLKVKKSYIGSLYITDKDANEVYTPSYLLLTLKKNVE